MPTDIRKLRITDTVKWSTHLRPDAVQDVARQFGEGPFKVVGLHLRGGSAADGTVTIEVNGRRFALRSDYFEKA